jgi:hypothetical protein
LKFIRSIVGKIISTWALIIELILVAIGIVALVILSQESNWLSYLMMCFGKLVIL